MSIDMSPFFIKYEALVTRVESVFEIIKRKFPEEVCCKPSCADCCFALFDLTLIEAMYVNHQFHIKFSGSKKEELLEKASHADRKTYKIKKAAFKSKQNGVDEEQIITEIAKERIRCPLLNNENMCDLYDFRPIACRVYGIPVAIGGKGRTCGYSGFTTGQSYPTLNHDIIHDQLLSISNEFVNVIHSKYKQMSDILVPVSMALITDYDENYLGISVDSGSLEKEADEEEK
jgi:Fe-S-cluster containining protein